MNPTRYLALLLLITIVLSVQSSEEYGYRKEQSTQDQIRILEDSEEIKSHPHHPPPSNGGGGGGSSSSGGSSGGGSGGSSGGSGNSATAEEAIGPRRKSGVILVGGAALVGAAWAASLYRNRRKVAVEVSHPLAGSISKRVNIFQNLAGANNNQGSRPDRVIELEASPSSEKYARMDGAMV